MKATLSIVIPGIALLSTALPVWAHHSFASEFDEHQPVTLVGTLTKMEWVNPHGWITMDVAGKDGTIEHWSIEAGNPNAMLRRGMRKTDFPAGVKITVEGFRAKNGTTTDQQTTDATVAVEERTWRVSSQSELDWRDATCVPSIWLDSTASLRM
jgi:hypothetical protein